MAKQSRQTEPSNVQAADDGKLAYQVTDRAPGRIGGKRVELNATVLLTEEEARAELLAGHLAPAAASKPA
ncbi:hypothetical protein LH464_17445 [Neorhizobium sp. T786]|uniref:hypothetical protein n=1 Tax=Pseudorhizobium xiangyangii TaxID=2883104 RepID=UPI001CFF5796|nr:hypothetical protein [Neorhizobium xiangyangii]MCB5204254.1 hypothetical protein [Neorhizobium xiangyangii]